ncbi:ADAMTS-like protein 5 [Protopterus annectens]|uniref:ADAMTS-like protein 5 n=1 Tax=Protopterus annectens TaxID=7888 RepID=UPI001CFAA7F0|nr:ADAMTS-like protein 5 [Protopterus annectens]
MLPMLRRQRIVSNCGPLACLALTACVICLAICQVLESSFSLGAWHRQRRQLRFGNEWTSWISWSRCSSTCGGGAAIRTRKCIIRNPAGETCQGDQRQYKLCNPQDCPEGTVDFREHQCSVYNSKQILPNQHFEWVPFFGGLNPCELSCLAKGQNFYYSFGRVLDGTRCHADSNHVCINGKCLKAGCDQILGSEQKEDACRVCGGLNHTCMKHHNIYTTKHPSSGVFGYSEVTMIPAGATHIRVIDNSRNYLALRNGNAKYLINGNWDIDQPGEYNAAGTKIYYKRSPDDHESLEAMGPTQEDLHIMVLLTEPNSGIEYEYWLPTNKYSVYHGQRSPLQGNQQVATFIPPPQFTTTRRPKRVSITTAPAWRAPLQGDHQPQPRLERDGTQSNYIPQPPRHDNCGKCRKVRGKTNRVKQYCRKDFVLRAKIISKKIVGLETRYDVQIIRTYKNNYPLVRREYVWTPNICNCPLLMENKEYILMMHQHVNYERTLNRILLETDSFVRPYSSKEDRLLRDLGKECIKYGPRLRTNL